MVGPESARLKSCKPAGQSTRVGAAGENPGGLIGLAAPGGVEWGVEVLGKVDIVLDALLQGQPSEIGDGELLEGGGLAPVSVLEDDDGAAQLLGKQPGQPRGCGVSLVEVCAGLLSRVDHEDGRPRALPVLDPVPESLAECALAGVVVVEELLERAPAGGALVGAGDAPELDRLVDGTDLDAISAHKSSGGQAREAECSRCN